MNRFLLMMAFMASALALAPPHPDFQEEYNKRRRRFLRSSNNNATFSSPGFLLNPQLCSDLSDTDCRRLNMNYAKNAKVNLEILKEKRMVRTLVLLVRFTDHVGRDLPERASLDQLWNSDQISQELPTGSIRRYLQKNSYNRLYVEASVTDWLTSDNTELHYSFDKSGLTTQLAASMYPVLDQLDQQNYDFSKHDLNGDMVIDSLVVRILMAESALIFSEIRISRSSASNSFFIRDTQRKLAARTVTTKEILNSASGLTLSVTLATNGSPKLDTESNLTWCRRPRKMSVATNQHPLVL